MKELMNITGLSKDALIDARGLYLSRNNLTSLPAEIVWLKNLEEIYLNDNNLASLPSEIGGLKNLRMFCLEDNCLEALPAEIVGLTNLEVLNLICNSLKILPAEIGALPKLRRLYIDRNPLQSTEDVLIFKEVGRSETTCAFFIKQKRLIGGCFIGGIDDFRRHIAKKYEGGDDYGCSEVLEIISKYE